MMKFGRLVSDENGALYSTSVCDISSFVCTRVPCIYALILPSDIFWCSISHQILSSFSADRSLLGCYGGCDNEGRYLTLSAFSHWYQSCRDILSLIMSICTSFCHLPTTNSLCYQPLISVMQGYPIVNNVHLCVIVSFAFHYSVQYGITIIIIIPKAVNMQIDQIYITRLR